MQCVLCLEEHPSGRYIDIFSAEGVRLNLCEIISKHFWLQPSITSDIRAICKPCWIIVEVFHQFYEKVLKVHNRIEIKDVQLIEDPLPQHEVVLKSEDGNAVCEVSSAIEEDFFESVLPEVKVEVTDLDLLPKVEIIESGVPLSDRALRASRRNNQIKPPKPIKLKAPSSDEDDKSYYPPGVESEKTDAFAVEKPRRGRPKKSQESIQSVGSQESIPKSEEEFVSCSQLSRSSGSEDNAGSSSSDSDSGDSLPDFEPEERYAEIPKKRVVVKPKKYRKRPKPLVPPKRMTREEIDQKNAQQAEYDKVIGQFFGKFACPKCNLLVKNFGDMRHHFRASHPEEPGYMLCCGRKFQVRKNLAEHVYVHWNPDHFKCSACGKVFQDGRTLEVHELSHTSNLEVKEKKTFPCDQCPKVFTTKAAMHHHSLSKHVPKSEFKFACTECDKKLPTERKLKDHMKYMHDPESAIICDKCGKKLRSHSNLKKHHLLEHSDVPRPTPIPMQCEICGTWLRHLSGLKQHMKSIHEEAAGEHRCHICNKTSTNARALKRHIYHNHECERKYKCTMCEKAFKRRQDLREHTSTHTGEVLYTCPNCPMTFFSNANMYKHRQRLHRAEWLSGRKKPLPPNIMKQAVGATEAMKMKQAIDSSSSVFFLQNYGADGATGPNQPQPNPDSGDVPM